jgi:hypothetical protein
VSGERTGTTASSSDVRRQSRKPLAAAEGAPVIEPEAGDAPPFVSSAAEEDETLYAQFAVPRIPPAIPYVAPDDLPIPGDDLSDPDLTCGLALNRVKGIGPARYRRFWTPSARRRRRGKRDRPPGGPRDSTRARPMRWSGNVQPSFPTPSCSGSSSCGCAPCASLTPATPGS